MTTLLKTTPHVHPVRNPISFHSSPTPVVLSFRFYWNASLLHTHLSALKAAATSDGDNLMRKPVLRPQVKEVAGISDDVARILDEGDSHRKTEYEYEYEYEKEETEDERWVDWEDQILEDTVPLVGFVRMILHSGEYGSGDRLSPEHEKTILEKLLPFHPEFEKKIGCGIDYITVGYHPNFERSRCLFIARKDGELVDFSYWKCIKGLIRKNYPLYADSFILRHFRKHSRNL